MAYVDSIGLRGSNVNRTRLATFFPRDVEQTLRARFGDLSEAAREAFLVQSYREGRLSVVQVAAVIGKGFIETQAWLANKGAPLSYSTEELEEDRKALAKLRTEPGR